ncbi:ABC transporter ATP-binding protein [Candidatus Bathyarchaeota archaeon]|nr:ABC transporter ATP-binding protein [Candidatus Bathyarchaeota archaeon]
MPLLQLEQLSKWFEIKRTIFSKPLYLRAVDGVNLSLEEGEAISIVGESGCGKTTLGKTILRLYEPTGGKIIFEGRDITFERAEALLWYKRRAQIVQQDPFGSLPPFFTVYRILEEPLLIHQIGNAKLRREMIYKALETVRLTPVEEFAPKYPHMLSGGQRQRVAIARAMILRPKLIVADEPVSMLDASVRIEILKLMRDLQKRFSMSFIYITHDLATTRYFSERISIMYAGQIIEIGPSNNIINEPLHPYTQALLKAIPDPDANNRKIFREVPPGEPPNLISPPPGCRFHPRCPYTMDICRIESPPEIYLQKDHMVRCWLYAKK